MTGNPVRFSGRDYTEYYADQYLDNLGADNQQ